MRRRETVVVSEAVGKFPAVTGTLRTLYGRRVIEVHKRYYLSADQRFEAVRYGKDGDAGWWGWIVRSANSRDSSDPIYNKRAAIEDLADWAERDAADRKAKGWTT